MNAWWMAKQEIPQQNLAGQPKRQGIQLPVTVIELHAFCKN